MSRSLYRDRQIQPLALQETHGPLTVRLEWGYADANIILIGYRIRSTPSAITPYRILLQDAGGRTLPYITSQGVAGASQIFGLSLPAGESVFIAASDPWALPGWPADYSDELSLRLIMELVPTAPQMPASPSLSNPAPGTQVPATAIHTPADVSLSPFVFTFSLRVLPGEAWGSPQTTQAGGISLTLTRWVRSPSGARARLCFSPADPHRQWLPIAEWIIPGAVIPGEAVPVSWDPPTEICRDLFFPISHSHGAPSGPTSLRILELIGWDREDPQAPLLRHPGPWIFKVP